MQYPGQIHFTVRNLWKDQYFREIPLFLTMKYTTTWPLAHFPVWGCHWLEDDYIQSSWKWKAIKNVWRVQTVTKRAWRRCPNNARRTGAMQWLRWMTGYLVSSCDGFLAGGRKGLFETLLYNWSLEVGMDRIPVDSDGVHGGCESMDPAVRFLGIPDPSKPFHSRSKFP